MVVKLYSELQPTMAKSPELDGRFKPVEEGTDAMNNLAIALYCLNSGNNSND
ncbi:MAG: hypothetical protein KJ556_08615 [Gammaproteobacteria bacterium]|nr:hypothetical protein [Gammaproteobacteria bacterium]MBU2057114.1 hypothetical protein [Gammaproteobacteria bacterium]MBU2175173.1 hypothetical protein [Gammaproteobacteria bacterium]MBU2245204.1 hypothetical protein [Gammaproteobacteria bacterium]MBU2346054.1 hypothetical protein [Gammaproteobacteria bacterium]